MNLVLPPLNAIVNYYAGRYGRNVKGLEDIFRATDIFVFESACGLFLFDTVKALAPKAKMIYRVSDDLRILGSTPESLLVHERKIVSRFDVLSVPSVVMREMFPDVPIQLDRHGLDKQMYDESTISPYVKGSKNAVFVGTGYLDKDFLACAAEAHPTVDFHIIGPIADTLHKFNVRFWGEMAFRETVPFVKFADLGLATRSYRKGFASTLTDSLKIIQYRYCGLPIISPDFIDLHRDGVFYYSPKAPHSCGKAIKDALASGKNPHYADEVQTWDEVARSVLQI